MVYLHLSKGQKVFSILKCPILQVWQKVKVKGKAGHEKEMGVQSAPGMWQDDIYEELNKFAFFGIFLSAL